MSDQEKIPEDNNSQEDISQESPQKGSGDNYMAEGMCIGMCLGIAVGQFFFDNMSIGLAIGLSVGLVIGMGIKKKN